MGIGGPIHCTAELSKLEKITDLQGKGYDAICCNDGVHCKSLSLVKKLNENHLHYRLMQNSPQTGSSSSVQLSDVPAGQRVRLQQISSDDRTLSRRMLGLGLRNGVEVDIVQLRSNGVVIARGETRIALGAGVADKLLVTLLGPVA